MSETRRQRTRRLLERLRELPGGRELLELAAQARRRRARSAAPCATCCSGTTPRELDVVVDGTADAFAEQLAVDSRWPPRGRMACAVARRARALRHGGRRVGRRPDRRRARARRVLPGARARCRTCAPGSVEEDLRAARLHRQRDRRGARRRARAASCARRRTRSRTSRRRACACCTTTASSTTPRACCASRATARGWASSPTSTPRAWPPQAIAAGALATVSRARIGAELRLALAEPDPVAALESLQRLGVLSALHEAIELDAPLARAALAALPPDADGRPDVLLLASLLLPGPCLRRDRLPNPPARAARRLGVPGRRARAHGAQRDPRPAHRRASAPRASAVADLRGRARRAAGGGRAGRRAGRGRRAREAADAARRWLQSCATCASRSAATTCSAPASPPGPEIGRRLRRALSRKLDGELERRGARPSCAPRWRTL